MPRIDIRKVYYCVYVLEVVYCLIYDSRRTLKQKTVFINYKK